MTTCPLNCPSWSWLRAVYWLLLPRLNPKHREPPLPMVKGVARGPLPLKPPEAPSGRRPAMLRAEPREQPLLISRRRVANERRSRTAKDAALDLRPLRSLAIPSGPQPAMLQAAPPVPPQPSTMLPVANGPPSPMAKDVVQVQQPLRATEVRSARLLEMLQDGPRVQPLNGVDRPVTG